MSDEKKAKLSKYKVQYKINTLSSICEHDGQLIEALANSEELSMFKTDLVKDCIEFKW